jgi:hypothetical protein
VREERDSYYARRKLAIDKPDEYLSIIIDGTSQSDYSIPHFATPTKESASAAKLPTHLVGCLIHGAFRALYATLPNIRNNANLTVEVLFRVLSKVEELKGKLPPKLFLQLDNCT